MKNFELVTIDGSFGEGGGAILRTALALSAILQKPCEVFNIRKGRKPPGLKPQHLISVKQVAKLCSAFVEGAELGSTEIKFYPQKIQAKDLHVKIDTAGSITLCLQNLLPVCFFAPKPVEIFFEGGGTDVPFSPPWDYYQFVFFKLLEKIGAKVEGEVERRGFWPAGGAKAKVKVFPSKWETFSFLERGKLKKVSLFSVASQHLKEKKVAERQVAGAKEILGKINIELEERKDYVETISPGSAFCLVAEFEKTVLGFDRLGEIGKRSEEIGKECALEFLKMAKNPDCLDFHAADQILIYMALAQKESKILVSQLSLHAYTNIFVIEKFLSVKFEFQNGILTCKK